MGVPKFFRFISARYPCINKIIKEYEIPEYDNLYLDMNSIVHTCSHPADADIHFRIGKKEFSDEDIFQNVSRYVEIIFQIVKPKELMFLAFDGVAPRAKINQQRANRFRAARNLNKSQISEEILNDDDRLFDANCITPGTLFMTELITHMKHFVAYKVSTDPLWQKCKIILSGSEVPGEGEHKIMQFVRYNKAQPNYNHNTRHCLYSLDADMIILGLCLHEPHFSLLRECATFGKMKKMLTPEESDFYLLHLSLMREYVEYEFASIKSKLIFNFNLENIIDDWVLIGFLIGNDFIPNLPNLHIVNGALPLLYQVYIEVLPTLDGYINEFGELHLARFEKFMNALAKSEIKILELTKMTKTCNDAENKIDIIKKDFEKIDINIKSGDVLEGNEIKSNAEYKSRDSLVQSQKEYYYKKKLKFSEINESIVSELVEQYIRAIQWTLSYYYHGCCSWSWFYPYHYAPFISDIKNLQQINMIFSLGEPFLPLQHLLAVLPPASNHLLPKSLRVLVTSSKSIIVDFYPENFEIDQNGKSNEWEAVVLLPFIDEIKLIEAMKPYITSLTVKERKRNTNGATCIYIYTEKSLGQYAVDTIYDEFINHAQLDYIKPADLFVQKNKLVKGLCKNVRFDLNFPGFPTLKHISHSLGKEVTQSNTTVIKLLTEVETLVLNVLPKPIFTLEEIAKALLGQSVYINWPYLKEAYVVGVTDFKEKVCLQNFWKNYSTDNLKHETLSEFTHTNELQFTELITETYRKNLAINIGETKFLVYVFPKMGKRYICGNMTKVQLHIKWSSLIEKFPYQLIVNEKQIPKASFMLYKSVTDIFAASSYCFMIGHPHYGSMGEVKNVFPGQKYVAVSLKLTEEPDFKSCNEDFFAASPQYMSSKTVASRLNISYTLVNRITGSLIITEESDGSTFYDIGLRIKLPKYNKELWGYTKKKNNYWSYSDKVILLLQNYIEKFPNVFININNNPDSSTFTLSDIFPEGLEALKCVKTWLAEQEASYTAFLECGTKTLGFNGVSKLDTLITDFTLAQQDPKVIETKVSSQLLFKPGMTVGLVPPDIKAQHVLLDRIICIRENFTVPLGLKGTIIGIQEKEDRWKYVYEVLFDSSFTGGLTLYESSEHKCYRLTTADFINISFGQRAICPKPKTSKTVMESKDTSNTEADKGETCRNVNSKTSCSNEFTTPKEIVDECSRIFENNNSALKESRQNRIRSSKSVTLSQDTTNKNMSKGKLFKNAASTRSSQNKTRPPKTVASSSDTIEKNVNKEKICENVIIVQPMSIKEFVDKYSNNKTRPPKTETSSTDTANINVYKKKNFKYSPSKRFDDNGTKP